MHPLYPHPYGALRTTPQEWRPTASMVLATQAKVINIPGGSPCRPSGGTKSLGKFLLPQAWGWGAIQTKRGRKKRPQQEALERAHTRHVQLEE